MITIFSNFYVDEVDLDFKSTSPEDEDKGSEGKKHVAMETVCLHGWNLCCMIFHIMKHLVCIVHTVHVMHVCFSGQVFVCFSLTSDNLNVA